MNTRCGRLLLTVALCIFIFQSSARAAGVFLTAQDFAVGGQPTAIVTGDFNGDSIPDLATADTEGNSVSVLLGNGHGTFQQSKRTPAGFAPAALAAADFDGDGKLDLVVLQKFSGTILLGNGDGTFQTPLNFPSGRAGTSVGVGDFNRDGKLDLIVAVNSVQILLGNGDGSFHAGQMLAGQADTLSLLVADFNGDGKLDAATANGTIVAVSLGNGDGTFGNAVSSPAGSAPRFVAAGDLNADGHIDLAVTNQQDTQVSILQGKGDGSFLAPHAITADVPAFGINLVDLNGDGKLDLAVAEKSADDVFVMLGRGDATFVRAASLPVVGPAPVALVAGDFNQDGRIDLASANSGVRMSRSSVTVLLGKNNGNFTSAQNFPLNIPAAVAKGDFNGDGVIDLAVTSQFHNTVSILLGPGFRSRVSFKLLGTGFLPIVATDINHDGKTDLICGGSTNASVLLGNGDGSFQAALNVDSPSEVMALVDLNGDGKVDMVGAALNGSTMYISLSNGDGTFQSPATITITQEVLAIATGDLNGDRKPDVAVGGIGHNAGLSIGVLLSNGDGTLQTPADFAAHNDPTSIKLVDLNKDGKVDLITAGEFFGISVFLGNGNGTFGDLANYFFDNLTPQLITIGDFNADGILDVAAPNRNGGLTLMQGNGDGTLQFAGLFSIPPSPGAVVSGDFNGDGLPDLALANGQAVNAVTLLLNIP